MSRKIVPPVTPRIVRDNPRRRRLLAAVSIVALLLTAWFSYDYGRGMQPLIVDGGTVMPADSARLVEQLEQERDALRQQVAELQQGMEQANQSLGASQARIQALQEALSASSTDIPQEVEVVVTPAVTAPATAEAASEEVPAAVADDALLLGDLEVEPTESADTFRLRFSVGHTTGSSERVTGNIWIAVNGMVNRKPRRLSLKALSPQKRAYVKMGFDRQQDVLEDVVLPAEFVPKNILVEAKPYGDRLSSVSRKFSWETGR